MIKTVASLELICSITCLDSGFCPVDSPRVEHPWDTPHRWDMQITNDTELAAAIHLTQGMS